MSAYAELAAATNFSFLRGASPAEDMVAAGIALGLAGIGIADRNSVAGVVRAHVALKDARARACAAGLGEIDFRLAVGARLVFADGTPDIVAYPATRHGWGRLTRLLTTGNLRAEKGGCILRFADLLAHLDDLLLIVLPRASEGDARPVKAALPFDHGAPVLRLVEDGPADLADVLRRLSVRAPDRLWLGVAPRFDGRDRRHIARHAAIAAAAGIPLLAIGDALYATPDARPLHDIVTCIREGLTIDRAGRRLLPNAERHLKSGAAMARLFRAHPEALAQTGALLARIAFTLDDLRYEYPHEPVPEGWSPQDWLAHMTREAARRRWPDGVPPAAEALIEEELRIVGERRYAAYFLTVHDIVKFARAQDPPILCQGRGSAANSMICFLLGITSVDPAEHNLLFSRFVSEERDEPPDIDVDFEHERREEVMQYVYRRYGRHRAGIVATIQHFRARGAVREVGKALGLSEDVTGRLTATIWGSYATTMDERRFHETGFAPDNPEIARLNALVGQLLNFPRHLGQHVGGFVLTEGRLDETVPIHNAAMPDRSFIEWDKDDIDALGLMKVDILALGMLTCIRKAFDLMRANGLGDHGLEVDLPADDPAVYDMLCRGDSIGVFQIESRAQMNMLPRLRPRAFYDLVIQVAIVRPGPIQGDMVHPYLRRRKGAEAWSFPAPAPPHAADELHGILGKTLGVPLFQEQAMKLAIVAAGFTPGEANQLRRAMATFRNVGTMPRFEAKMVGGMMRRGYEEAFARRCFEQIKGFGSYGFPESHALSFARLVYVSSWIKHYHPALFCAALLNAQPMGFYAPAQIVRDAREHGVEVRPIDVNASAWDNGIERAEGAFAVRLGFRQIDGFREEWGQAIAAARPFAAIEELARRARLPARALRLLGDADAMGSLDLGRREAIWEVRRTPPGALPLFEAAMARELAAEPPVALPAMPPPEQVAADYQVSRLSLKGHPMTFLRPVFAAERVLDCATYAAQHAGACVKVAGVVLVRQRPGAGKAIFITLEDETGVCNVVMWARTFERFRHAVMASRLMLVTGEVQRSSEGVMHLMARRVEDRSAELARLSPDHDPRPLLSRADEFAHPQHPRHAVPRGRHPREVRIIPASRDFH